MGKPGAGGRLYLSYRDFCFGSILEAKRKWVGALAARTADVAMVWIVV